MSEGIFSALTIIVLSLAIIAFLISLIYSYKEEHVIKGNYNFYFSLFLLGWILIELVNHFSEANSELLFQFFHMLILLILAIWMNVRFFWAIKTAKSEE